MTSYYPSYKPSEIDWLPQIPMHWNSERLASLFDQVAEAGDAELPVLSVSIHSGVTDAEIPEEEQHRQVVRSEDRSKYKRVRPGDLVYNMMRAWQGGFGTVAVDGAVSPAYVVARPSRGEVLTRYVEALLRTPMAVEEMRRNSRGVTDFRLRLYWEQFRQMRIPVPPLAEQQAIAAFLDRETAKLDALIEEQRRLIALLKEKRQAVISHAVTRGLDPTAPLKPSGIDWLGDIPAHWEAVKMRRLIKAFEQGWSPDCHSIAAAPGEWGVLKTGCVNNGIYRETENKTLPEGVNPRPSLEVKPGDLVMSRASGSPQLIGSVALIERTQERLMLSDKLFRLRLREHQKPRFVRWLFASNAVREQIILSISGADGMANNLPQSKIREILVPLAPVEEQRQIADHLDTATAQFDALTTEATRAINLLQERRAALISAAVTGKIDLRDEVPEITEAA